MKDRNAEGYPDPTAARAIKAADRPPEEIIMFRKMIKALSVICHVRVLGKVTLGGWNGSQAAGLHTSSRWSRSKP